MGMIDPPDRTDRNYTESFLPRSEASSEKKITPKEAIYAGVCCFIPEGPEGGVGTRDCLCCGTWTTTGLGVATATTYAVQSAAAPYFAGFFALVGGITLCCYGNVIKC